MRVAFDAGDVVVRRRFRIAGEEVARKVHRLDVMLHAEIAHAEEVNARLEIGDVGIELFEEGIRVQRRRETRFARVRQRRVGRVCCERRERGEAEEVASA